MYALATLFNNTIKELVTNTQRSKSVVLELLGRASDGLKSLAESLRGFMLSMHSESFVHKEKVSRFFEGFYENIQAALGLEADALEDPDFSQTCREINGITQEDTCNRDSLLKTADLTYQFFAAVLGKVEQHLAASRQHVALFSAALQHLAQFDERYAAVKQALKAAGDGDEFFKTLYGNYNTEMNFVMKNYFTFFEIVQKGLRKAHKNSIAADVAAVEKRLQGKLVKVEAGLESLRVLNRGLRATLGEMQGQLAGDSEVLVLCNFIRDMDRDLRNLFLTVFQETEVFLVEPLQLFERSVRSMENLLKEVSEHSDIEKAFLSVIDSSENSMLETLKNDPQIKHLLTKSVDISLCNQLAFQNDFDIQLFMSTVQTAFSEWSHCVGCFLRPDKVIRRIDQGMFQHDKAAADRVVPLEVDSYLDLSEEDLVLASAHKFEARLSKKSLPHNGCLYLANDFFVFYSSSLAGSVHLLVPYDDIREAKSRKNLFGMNNGSTVETKRGPLEFYLAGSSKRDEFNRELARLMQIHRSAGESAITEEFSFRPTYTSIAQHCDEGQITSDLLEASKARNTKLVKKLKIGTFDGDSLMMNKTLFGGYLGPMVHLWFGIKPFLYDGGAITNLLYNWREMCGLTNIEQLNSMQFPPHVAQPATDYEGFLEGAPLSTSMCFFETAQGLKLKEKLTLFYTHFDQVAVIISLLSGAKLEFEALYMLRQDRTDKGLPTVNVKAWRKAGLKPSPATKDLYSERFVDYLFSVGEQKLLADKGMLSRFSDMK